MNPIILTAIIIAPAGLPTSSECPTAEAVQQVPDHLVKRTWLSLESLGIELCVRDPREHGRKQRNGVAHDDFQHLSAKTSAWPVGTRLRIRNNYGSWLDLVVTDNDLSGKPGKIDNALYLSGKAFGDLWKPVYRREAIKWEVSVE